MRCCRKRVIIIIHLVIIFGGCQKYLTQNILTKVRFQKMRMDRCKLMHRMQTRLDIDTNIIQRFMSKIEKCIHEMVAR